MSWTSGISSISVRRLPLSDTDFVRTYAETAEKVNNDFHKTHDIFDLFKGLTVKNLDVEIDTSSDDTAELTQSNLQNGSPAEHSNHTKVDGPLARIPS
jgi:hypothetical protein